MKSIVKALTPSKDGFRGTSLEATCQMATAKTLNAPDPDLNAQVVQVLNSGRCSSQEIISVIKGRLGQKNPHKVYLAIVLLRQLLAECDHVLAPLRSQIFAEVAIIASTPMNRYGNDLHSQQVAKQAAYELLNTYNVGPDGHARPGYRMGHAAPLGGMSANDVYMGAHPITSKAQKWEALQAATEKGIASATSFAERMQDLLIAYSSDTADAASKARTKEQMRKVSTDVEAFRQVMERVLAQLAGFDEDGAPALTTKALEAVDLVNNALDMQAEIIKSAEEGPPPPPPSVAPASGHTLAGTAAAAPSSASAVVSAPANAPDTSPLDIIAELQQALDAVHVGGPFAGAGPAPPAYPVQDPFAIPAAAPATGNPFAAPAMNPLAYGPGVHAPTSPPAFAAAPQAFGPSPFGPSAFTQGHVQSPPAGVSVPAHAGATGAAFPPLTSPGDAFSTPPFFGSSPAFAPATFSAAPLSAHPPPAEDAFAAIAEEALRSSPRAPVGFKARDRSRTSSITSEPGVSPSETKEAPSATGVLASGGPQGGLAGLQVVPVPEVSGVALETLPDAGQELPPLPDAPVRFESKGAPPVAVDAAVSTQPPHGPKSQPAFNGPAAHSGAAFAPGAVDAKVPTPLGPPVVVEAGAAVDGHQTAAETPDWDAFFVDRLGQAPGTAKEVSSVAATTDPFHALALERQSQPS